MSWPVADHAGAKQGTTKTYDPFGVALAGLPDNSAGNLDYGWLGQHQRPIEHAGARWPPSRWGPASMSSIGRYLEVDPVEGGSCNDYDYVCGDPVNNLDLDGTHCRPWHPHHCVGAAAGAIADLVRGDDGNHGEGEFHRSVHGPGHDDRCC